MAGNVMVSMVRSEMTKVGFKELRTAAEVVEQLPVAKGSALVFINSMCGCAGGCARPAVAMALAAAKKRPDHLFTVFAGQDLEATEKARTYFTGYSPSSPAMAFMRDGKIVAMIERHQVEGKRAEDLAKDIGRMFDEGM